MCKLSIASKPVEQRQSENNDQTHFQLVLARELPSATRAAAASVGTKRVARKGERCRRRTAAARPAEQTNGRRRGVGAHVTERLLLAELPLPTFAAAAVARRRRPAVRFGPVLAALWPCSALACIALCTTECLLTCNHHAKFVCTSPTFSKKG